ncbi:MAG: SafA/ExsA family spore coat assembly protein [Oscillospiraceae bacterium]
MKKPYVMFATAVLTGSLLTAPAKAASLSHTVASGDTMWKLAVQYQVGTSEIIQANPQVSNPNLIYPGQVLQIPQLYSSVSAYEEEVIRLVNNIRQQNGLQPLTANWELSRVARYKSQDMLENGYFSHNSPTYGSPFQMITAFGLSYRTAGENIAKGYASAQAVVNGWMNSSGHRANILNSSYKQIGVGYVAQGHYWTQMFIG